MESTRTRHTTEVGGFIPVGTTCKCVTQPAWNKPLACKAKTLQIDVAINLINAVPVQTYWMLNFTAAQMELSRGKKFGLCIHLTIGARVVSVMKETQGKQKSGPGLCDWEGRDGTMRVELELWILGIIGVSWNLQVHLEEQEKGVRGQCKKVKASSRFLKVYRNTWWRTTLTESNTLSPHSWWQMVMLSLWAEEEGSSVGES